MFWPNRPDCDRTFSLPFHFGASDRVLFGWYHPPRAEQFRDVGIVLCNPIGDDYIRAHRTLRHFAERLADLGFSVLRFDFHGTGDSSGTEGDKSRVETWLGDIDLAVAELRSRANVKKVGIAGLRMGATLAALAASRREDIDSLILWNPFLSGKSFVVESTKLHKMHRILEPHSFAIDPPGRDIGGEEALGFFLSQETMNELEKRDLLKLDGKPANAALVIGASNVPSEESLLSKLRTLHVTTDYRHLPGHKFLIMINHAASVPTQVLDEMTSWLEARYSRQNTAPRTAENTKSVQNSLGEEPIVFGQDDSLFGILNSPQGSKPAAAETKRPAIILINAGTVHRIGPHRLYVRMAREWAQLGFHVFRVDLSGIGDSVVEPGTNENLCYPRRGIDDVRTAMKLLEERIGVRQFILSGLCSGADIAFQSAFQDPRVIGAVMMNPRTFCVHDLEMVETQSRTRYFKDSMASKEKWLRLLRGEVDLTRTIRVLVPDLIGRAQAKFAKKPNTAVTATNGEKTQAQPANDVPGCLKTMVLRGVNTYLVAAEKDPGVDYVDAHFGKKMKALEKVSGFRRTNFKGTDHTFTSLYAQQVVLDTITDHFKKNHLHS